MIDPGDRVSEAMNESACVSVAGVRKRNGRNENDSGG
jgi:hypothetical protein